MRTLAISRGDGAPLAFVAVLILSVAALWFSPLGFSQTSDKVALSTVALSALGVVFSFWQAERSRRKQFKTAYLIKAYQSIETAFSREYNRSAMYNAHRDEWLLDFENAIRDIQLMGSAELAGQAYAVTLNFDPIETQERRAKLLLTLRRELRKELGEAYVQEFPRSFRHLDDPQPIGQNIETTAQ
jgi:hypothetical protein